MNVKELIEALLAQPEDAPVVTEDGYSWVIRKVVFDEEFDRVVLK